MRGQVWRKLVDKEEVAALQAEHHVISSRLFAGRTIVHVLSDDRPDAGFEEVTPDLEDVYFAQISDRRAPVAA
jgi:hypothetical protein